MYRKVLVPLDMSRESEGVLGLVQRDLAWDGALILLHVIPPAMPTIMWALFSRRAR